LEEVGQGIFVGDCQHLFRCPGILHGKLTDQGRVRESLLEEHDDRFFVNLQNDVPLVAEALNKFLDGLSLLLHRTGQVLVNSRMGACGLKIADELSTQVRPGTD
jgi:hypothetical protein